MCVCTCAYPYINLSFFSGIPEELILPDLSVFRQNMMHSNESALHELQDQNHDIMTTNDSVMTSHDSIGPIGEFWKHSTSYLLNNFGFTHTQTHTHTLSLSRSLSLSSFICMVVCIYICAYNPLKVQARCPGHTPQLSGLFV